MMPSTTQEHRAPSQNFTDALVLLIPVLRTYAARKSGYNMDSEDLVQETLCRALFYSQSFDEASNLKAWLFKILQNCSNNSYRKCLDTVSDGDNLLSEHIGVAPVQDLRVHCAETLSYLARLPKDAAQLLLMIAEDGCSYEEAALRTHTPVGTVKSRINRAREKLTVLIDEAAAMSPCVTS